MKSLMDFLFNNKEVQGEIEVKAIFIMYLLSFVNIPYRWGGDDPMEGYDCSGFSQEAMSFLGLQPPTDMTSQQQYLYYLNDSVSNVRKTGSLAFYGKSLDKISHIAVLLDKERVIEFGGGGRNTNTIEDAIKQNAYGRVRDINHRHDLLAILTHKKIPW